jgi:hypothetical protein
MLPVAVIAHRLPGRLRVRIDERRRDDAYFSRVAEHLRQCPGVIDVAVTPLTGSVLILHETADTQIVADYAKAFELFEIVLPAAARRSNELAPDEVIRENLARVDGWMRREGGPEASLRSVAILGLVGAAVWQTARGQWLPATATLLWYALALTRDRRPPANGEATEASPAVSGGHGEQERPQQP